jgi:4-hydroxy-tetrahydrodipicolinate reductase
MGKSLMRAVAETPGMILHAAIDRAGTDVIGQDAGSIAGLSPLGVSVTTDALEAFVKAHVVLDFTAPSATVAFAGLAAQARLVHVIGTTGMSEADVAALKAAARHAVIIRSGNFSLGVNLLAALVKQAAARFGADWDIEILETHHRAKIDAPSGTALLLGEAAAAGRGALLSDLRLPPHDGVAGPRPLGKIGVASLRGGVSILLLGNRSSS